MIAHALNIVREELYSFINPDKSDNIQVVLGSPADAATSNTVKDKLCISVVNISEEKTLKNLPCVQRNFSTLTATTENQPVFLNLMVLITATHAAYQDALDLLSRTIIFFQSGNVFTQDNVQPESVSRGNFAERDRLETFKLIFDLYSPTLEEANHLWGMLGGKQYPFVLYRMRMLELKFRHVFSEGRLVSGIVTSLQHKIAAGAENG